MRRGLTYPLFANRLFAMPITKTSPIVPASALMVLNRAGPRLHRPAHRWARACRRHPCLADAAGRHRSGRGHLAGGAARALRGNQHPLGRKLGEIDEWLTYDIPRDIVGQAWKGRYRGQTQKWYALRFTGDEQRDRHRASRRRAQARIHGLALGADRQPARPHRAVQAPGLRARGAGIRKFAGK